MALRRLPRRQRRGEQCAARRRRRAPPRRRRAPSARLPRSAPRPVGRRTKQCAPGAGEGQPPRLHGPTGRCSFTWRRGCRGWTRAGQLPASRALRRRVPWYRKLRRKLGLRRRYAYGSTESPAGQGLASYQQIPFKATLCANGGFGLCGNMGLACENPRAAVVAPARGRRRRPGAGPAPPGYELAGASGARGGAVFSPPRATSLSYNYAPAADESPH